MDQLTAYLEADAEFDRQTVRDWQHTLPPLDPEPYDSDAYSFIAKHHHLTVNIEGRDTTVTIYDTISGDTGIGIARCNEIDHYNREIGINIATIRAAMSLMEQMEALWMKRAKTKEEVRAARLAKKRS